MSEVITCLVETPLGQVVVKLERTGLELGERGGFAARWATAENLVEKAMSLEAFRSIVKAQLKLVYEQQVGESPPNITLNLASHQLIDDLIGWTKLNASQR